MSSLASGAVSWTGSRSQNVDRGLERIDFDADIVDLEYLGRVKAR